MNKKLLFGILAVSILTLAFTLSLASVSASHNRYDDSYLYGNSHKYNSHYGFHSPYTDSYGNYYKDYSKTTISDSYRGYKRTDYSSYYDRNSYRKTFSKVSQTRTNTDPFRNYGYDLWSNGPNYGVHRTSYVYSDSAYRSPYYSSYYFPVSFNYNRGAFDHRFRGY